MKTLYPPLDPHASHRIDVGGRHVLYVEECGNPRGFPVLFLHGGPGSGCSPDHRRYFDPSGYRIVLVDQRGAGRSTPLGGTHDNTTADLVSDLEIVRQRLGIERWVLFGGSWGATLALVYATHHPGRVLGMVLRGVFLARETDLAWFFHDIQRLLPQEWAAFADGLPATSQASDLIAWYHQALHANDRQVARQAANRWAEWGRCVVNWHRSDTAEPGASSDDPQTRQTRLLAKAAIETHYAVHRYFIGENEILERVGNLPAWPVAIVQGRFDLTCTLEGAWHLHRAMAGSRLIEVAGAGHLIDEPAMVSALVEETDRLLELLSTC